MYLEFRMMEKVQKPSDSESYIQFYLLTFLSYLKSRLKLIALFRVLQKMSLVLDFCFAVFSLHHSDLNTITKQTVAVRKILAFIILMASNSKRPQLIFIVVLIL
jgi:hypothetical protein